MEEPSELADATVLVTGGASNIGRDICRHYARLGANVGILDLDVEQAGRTARSCHDMPGQVLVTEGDANDAEDVTRCVDALEERFGRFDVLVNNAGWSRPGWFLEIDADEHRRTVDINLHATITATRVAIERFVPQGWGNVVSVASDAAFGDLRASVYGAAKAAVISLMRSLALEFGHAGIRFNTVCPGYVPPREASSVGENSLWAVGSDTVMNSAGEQYILDRTPLRRITTGEDVAHVVAFLSDPIAARQLTGQVLSVSGGYRMP